MSRRTLCISLRIACLGLFGFAPSLTRASAQDAFANPPAQAAPVAASPTLDGAWVGSGEVANAPDQKLFTFIRIARGIDARTTVRVIAPQLLAFDAPARDVRWIGANIAFTVDVRGASLRFDGTLDAANSALQGKWGFVGPSGKVEGEQQEWSVHRTYDLRELIGYEAWRGDLHVGGQQIAMAIAIGKTDLGPVGAIDIPVQGARGIPLIVVETPKGYRMTLPGGIDAIYEFERTADGSLVGSMTQGPFTAPLTLKPAPGYKVLGRSRPQDPQPPFPYTEREAAIAHPFGHSLAGTLTIPTNTSLVRDGKFPAVVLVSGSGAQNRDEELLGHRPFAVIADALARQGVAVLRYDDRGTGRSKGRFEGSDSLDFATDADAASEFLKTAPEIDRDRIGMLGHSEGGMIAPLVSMWQNQGSGATDPEMAALSFIVLLAAPGQRGAEVLSWQTAEIMRAEGISEAAVQAVVLAHVQVMNAILDKLSPEELRTAVEVLLRAQVAASGATLDAPALQGVLDDAVASMQDKWMSTFVAYDPIGALERCRVPVYAMAGEKDLQVDPIRNLELIAAATKKGGIPAQTRLWAGLNHLFQPCTTGSASEYGEIDTTFDAAALNEMVGWVVKTCGELPPRSARTPPVLPEVSEGVPASTAPASVPEGLQPASRPLEPTLPKPASL